MLSDEAAFGLVEGSSLLIDSYGSDLFVTLWLPLHLPLINLLCSPPTVHGVTLGFPLALPHQDCPPLLNYYTKKCLFQRARTSPCQSG